MYNVHNKQIPGANILLMDKFNHGQQWMNPGSIIVSDKVTKFNHRIINENFKSMSM